MPAAIKVEVRPGYKPQAENTSIETDVFEFGLLRQRSPLQRLQMASGMMLGARQLSLHCLKQHFQQLSYKQFARKVAEAWLQEDCPDGYVPNGSEIMWIQVKADATRVGGNCDRASGDGGVR